MMAIWKKKSIIGAVLALLVPGACADVLSTLSPFDPVRRAESKAAAKQHPLLHRAKGKVRIAPDVFWEPEMVQIPAGSFTMGSPKDEPERLDNEGPPHQVTIGYSFLVGKYEVTFTEWDTCVSEEGCRHRPKDMGWGRKDSPVIDVSWDDAQEFLRWLNNKTGEQYRLLTEAEWEYAARAGTTTAWPCGDDGKCLTDFFRGDVAWYDFNSDMDSDKQTHLVGTKEPNAFGVFDMYGNVGEWVEDCWNDDYSKTPTDGSAATTGHCSNHVTRGGSWVSLSRFLRSASRNGNHASFRSTSFGFRIAKNSF